ncbi:hypothetical protein BBP40_011698 [Aspergillus hancockii]|nr:hypothetical protein BBP40_011698 [Aspergillus hancockii]
MGQHLVDESPWKEEIEDGKGWGMALDVPEEWWDDLDVVDRMLVTGSQEEIFSDHIQRFVDLLRRRCGVDLVDCIALDEAQDGPLMDFNAYRKPGAMAQAVTGWIIATLKKSHVNTKI